MGVRNKKERNTKVRRSILVSYFMNSGPCIEDVGKFSRFLTPAPSVGSFFTTIPWQILKNTDILHGWSHMRLNINGTLTKP